MPIRLTQLSLHVVSADPLDIRAMARPDFPRSLAEFQSRFASEEDCRRYLMACRWPDGFRCPRCGKREACELATRELLQCRSCRHQASVTAGTVLHRTLRASHSLVTRSLAEVRLTQGIQNREQFRVAEFIEEISSTSTLDANARGVTLAVTPVDEGLAIAADRQVLAAVVANLLQNAFKFTRPRTTVTLRVGANAERVLIEVQDECGGLPSGEVNELFRPFEQRSADRTGIGLGLAFSRWGAEANEGRIYARNLPGRGCVFTVDLPRQPVPTVVVVQA